MATEIPDTVRSEAQAAFGEHLGRAVRIVDVRPVGGGCISPSARVETDAGEAAFLKWGRPEDPGADMFVEEARSLRAIASTGAVHVPEVIAVSELGTGGTPWLLLEWLEPGTMRREAWGPLGRSLARLHRTRGDAYGWAVDNYIGSLPQANDWTDEWTEFWREHRLGPQLRRAYDGGYFDTDDRHRFDRLLDRLDEWLGGDDPGRASLLHGDLWSGNVHGLADGSAAVIDPASYYGHREADLAMSELFGGFDPAFFRAYEEEWPLEPGYRSARRPIYQLYYLLVHVNLFGHGYVRTTLRTLSDVPL